MLSSPEHSIWTAIPCDICPVFSSHRAKEKRNVQRRFKREGGGASLAYSTSFKPYSRRAKVGCSNHECDSEAALLAKAFWEHLWQPLQATGQPRSLVMGKGSIHTEKGCTGKRESGEEQTETDQKEEKRWLGEIPGQMPCPLCAIAPKTLLSIKIKSQLGSDGTRL